MTMNFTDITKFDAEQAREHLERLRWPNGVACPHCGDMEVYTLTGKPDSKKPVRKGVYKCKGCRKQFTVTVGTLFEGSHIPLNKWLMAVSLMCSSKKGISSHQLHRMLGITYKTAWFMAHRIRYAMNQPQTDKLTGIIEVDETYIGGKPRYNKGYNKRGRGTSKTPVVALVQRDGTVRSEPMLQVNAENLKSFITKNVDNSAVVMTDDLYLYRGLKSQFKHFAINHSKKEYVKGDIHTNTIEGYFGLLKRGINGVFHHVSKKHLHRYLNEFDFRYNMRKIKDNERAVFTLSGIEGKRLLYREPKVV